MYKSTESFRVCSCFNSPALYCAPVLSLSFTVTGSRSNILAQAAISPFFFSLKCDTHSLALIASRYILAADQHPQVTLECNVIVTDHSV